jgi:hypothetical protein
LLKMKLCVFFNVFHHPRSINQVHIIPIANKMHFNVYDVFYSQCSHQHVSADIAAIFKVILLQAYKGTDVVSCVAVTP